MWHSKPFAYDVIMRESDSHLIPSQHLFGLFHATENPGYDPDRYLRHRRYELRCSWPEDSSFLCRRFAAQRSGCSDLSAGGGI